MQYTQITDNCFADQIGAQGLALDVFGPLLEKSESALQWIRDAHAQDSLPLLRLPAARDDLADARPAIETFLKDTTDVCLFGIGGSSLGAQTLAQLVGFATPGFAWPDGQPNFHILENLDAQTFAATLGRLNLKTTRFLVISKSGGTAEPMMQFLSAIAALQTAGMDGELKDRFLVVTEPKDNPLRRLAERLELPIFDHDPNVGGRYSVLSVVGLLPAMMMGLDPVKIREGAASVLDPILAGAPPSEIPPAIGASIILGLVQQHGINASVLMPYLDRLEKFAMWYRQLWGESLGKEGHGTTPVRDLGPVDQHSQLQLYLGGPNDKVFTVLMGAVAGTGATITDKQSGGDPDLSYLVNRTMGDLTDAEQRATADTLAANGRPVRVMKLDRLDEATMGALMMHFMLETIISAHLMGINAFDQPAVEEGKVLARKLLGEMG